MWQRREALRCVKPNSAKLISCIFTNVWIMTVCANAFYIVCIHEVQTCYYVNVNCDSDAYASSLV
jgi:hypothetical protein